MNLDDLGRPLALVLSYLSVQARSRLLQVLPGVLRGGVEEQLAHLEDLSRDQMGFVEQVLQTDLEAIFESETETRTWAEASPLRVSDLLALVFRQGTSPQAAGILLGLPPLLQGEILHKIAAQNWEVLERRLGRGELAFLKTLESAWERPVRMADPVFVADLLRHIPAPGAIRRLLTELYDLDPDSTGVVQDLLYGFNDLVQLTDRELQSVLTGVDHWDLVLALRPAPLGVRRKVEANISERRAAILAEDEGALEEVDDEQVRMVQHQIVERARSLYESGRVLTYFGSIAFVETSDIPETQPEPPTGQSSEPLEAREKPTSSRRYLLGAAVGGGCLVVAVMAMIWFMEGRSRRTSSRVRSAGLADVANEAVVEKPFEGKKGFRGGTKAALVEGRALLMSGKGVQFVEAKSVRSGDQVQTEANSRAAIRLQGDVGQIQMEANSSLQVGEAGQESNGSPQLHLRVGNIWVRVLDPALEVTSPIASMTASEGTLYHLRITLDATTTLAVHEGTVWLRSKVEGEEQFLVIGEGEQVEIEPSGGITQGVHGQKSGWLNLF
ncbi:MAG: FecR domain-containing protein [bacterium]|nr:FecR domain-containing protein [bacterium]